MYRRLVLIIVFEGHPGRVLMLKIAAGAEVIHSANILGEEKVQRPVECDPNLFVQAWQLAQVNRPPQPPREEAREIETENARHARPTTD